MQIIPQSIYTEPASIISSKQKQGVTSFSLQSFTSHFPNSISTPQIVKNNQHLIPKNVQSVPSDISLTREEALRLRNELLDNKKITQEEADALSYMFTFQGPYSLDSLIENITDAGKGLQTLSPEEYMDLQRVLQDLELSHDDRSKFLQYMNDSSYKEAWSLLASSLNTSNEDVFTKALPFLKELFLGKSKNTELPHEDSTLSKKDILALSEEIIESFSEHSTNPDRIKENITAELQKLLEQRKESTSIEEHSSQKESSFMQAERFSKIEQMTKDTHSSLIENLSTANTLSSPDTDDTSDSFLDEKSLLDYDAQMDLESDSSFKDSTQWSHTLLSKNLISTKTLQNQPLSFTKELQNTLFNSVQNSFLDMKNENMTSLVLQIKPNELGTILLSLQYHDGKISALLTPEQHDVTKLLEKSLPALSKSLEEQGLKIESLTVVQKEQNSDQQQNLYNQFFQKHHHQNAEQQANDSLRIGRLRKILYTAKLAKDNPLEEDSPLGTIRRIV